MARRLLPNGQQHTHGAEILVQRERALGDPPARRLLLELGSPGHPVGACLIGHICPMNTLTRAVAAATISGDTTVRGKRAGMEAAAGGVKVVGPKDGQEGFLGTIGVRFMIDGSEAGQRFSLVEHPMSPRALAAPLPLHAREDEYSYVLDGRMGALLGDDVVEAGPGDLVHKPRNQWHTFWNATDEPCRILEIISPAGFERFFAELVAMGGSRNAAPEELRALGVRYGLEVQPQSIPELLQRFGLRIGEPI